MTSWIAVSTLSQYNFVYANLGWWAACGKGVLSPMPSKPNQVNQR